MAAYLALATRRAPAVVQVQAPPPLSTQEVLVAADDLKQGQMLTDKNVRWQTWPDNALNGAFFLKSKSPDEVKTLAGSLVRAPFVSGEPIREAKLARPGTGFLSAILPAGKRAVAVRVSADTSAGGFILPNDRVDVIETTGQKGQKGDNDESSSISRTILTNIPVLAIDQNIQEKNGQSVVVGKTATLQLDPPQAELITAAESAGSLSLALRSIADSGDTQSTASAQRQSNVIQIFRAGQSQVVQTP
ncbi:pilus assembly protein CpaB [Faunimonas pinastri]|uniref:Pilus assembly protein CpaB n=2 Tax=Faunimonas pinastri TaxID=1855383 RepID=A0A1H9HHY7_9HYPH|nr:pilus assembly protein CpaB [Faunimonas pinastri]